MLFSDRILTLKAFDAKGSHHPAEEHRQHVECGQYVEHEARFLPTFAMKAETLEFAERTIQLGSIRLKRNELLFPYISIF